MIIINLACAEGTLLLSVGSILARFDCRGKFSCVRRFAQMRAADAGAAVRSDKDAMELAWKASPSAMQWLRSYLVHVVDTMMN